MDIKHYMEGVGRAARTASRAMAQASTAAKDDALRAMAQAIRASRDALLAANAADVAQARADGLDAALIDGRIADVVGLSDRGHLRPGLRADIVRFSDVGGTPVVREVYAMGRRVC
jgi:adenine deaminase